VKAKWNLWRLYNLATGYGQRPSEIVGGLETDLGRWYLDEACLLMGRRIEKLMNEGKDPFDDGVKTGKFRSTKGLAKKKVKIKGDGTW
jgi:hypothetical protein